MRIIEHINRYISIPYVTPFRIPKKTYNIKTIKQKLIFLLLNCFLSAAVVMPIRRNISGIYKKFQLYTGGIAKNKRNANKYSLKFIYKHTSVH